MRGSHSEWSPVISCVPQGPILESIVYFTYFNDTPNLIAPSTAKLFVFFFHLYKTLARLILEYAGPVWLPNCIIITGLKHGKLDI